MQQADHLLIPLLDGKFTVAQVAYVRDFSALLFITLHIAGPTTSTSPLSSGDVLAILPVDKSDLAPDTWVIFGYDALPHDLVIDRSQLDPGKPLMAPAIVEAFANALHGLYPWDGFPDPAFFTNLLRDPESLPAKARMTSDFPKPESQ